MDSRVVLGERVCMLRGERLVRAGELVERGLQALELLGAELAEGGEGVGDTEEGVAIAVEFEVFGALGD